MKFDICKKKYKAILLAVILGALGLGIGIIILWVRLYKPLRNKKSSSDRANRNLSPKMFPYNYYIIRNRQSTIDGTNPDEFPTQNAKEDIFRTKLPRKAENTDIIFRCMRDIGDKDIFETIPKDYRELETFILKNNVIPSQYLTDVILEDIHKGNIFWIERYVSKIDESKHLNVTIGYSVGVQIQLQYEIYEKLTIMDDINRVKGNDIENSVFIELRNDPKKLKKYIEESKKIPNQLFYDLRYLSQSTFNHTFGSIIRKEYILKVDEMNNLRIDLKTKVVWKGSLKTDKIIRDEDYPGKTDMIWKFKGRKNIDEKTLKEFKEDPRKLVGYIKEHKKIPPQFFNEDLKKKSFRVFGDDEWKKFYSLKVTENKRLIVYPEGSSMEKCEFWIEESEKVNDDDVVSKFMGNDTSLTQFKRNPFLLNSQPNIGIPKYYFSYDLIWEKKDYRYPNRKFYLLKDPESDEIEIFVPVNYIDTLSVEIENLGTVAKKSDKIYNFRGFDIDEHQLMEFKNDHAKIFYYFKKYNKIPGQFFSGDIKKKIISHHYNIEERYYFDVCENKRLGVYILLDDIRIKDCRVE